MQYIVPFIFQNYFQPIDLEAVNSESFFQLLVLTSYFC